MTDVFLGQIMLTGFPFAPKGFALCNGQLLSIAQNQALFSLLGTTYGGNGTTNFALPNLMSRTPVGFGNSVDPSWSPSPYNLGDIGGTETVTLTTSQMPGHNHQISGNIAAGTIRNPTGAEYGTSSVSIFAPASDTLVPLQGVGTAGNNQPHPNIQPYNTINFVIALTGIYPSRN
jgi:microcystin-dependent protein